MPASQFQIAKLIELPICGSTSKGWLAVAESPGIPFLPRRAYWTWGVPSSVHRGGHAHKELLQLLIPIRGSIIVNTEDPIRMKGKFLLDDPSTGLLLPPQYWHTMIFEKKAVLLCLASHEYDEGDYLRQFDEFIRYWSPKSV